MYGFGSIESFKSSQIMFEHKTWLFESKTPLDGNLSINRKYILQDNNDPNFRPWIHVQCCCPFYKKTFTKSLVPEIIGKVAS